MTKSLFRVFSIKMILLKIVTVFFLINNLNLAWAEKTPPSFSFSETKGLEPLEPSFSKTKEASQTENHQSEGNQVESDKNDFQEANQFIEGFKKKQELDSTEAKVDSREVPENPISEDFAPEKKENIEGIGFLDSLLEDSSWFFQKKETKRKIGLIPIPSYDRSHGLRLDLRFFTYARDKKGYYFAFSGSQYLFRPFNRFNISYIGNKKGHLKREGFLIYDNHYENSFGERGMFSKLSDIRKLYAHRLMAGYKVFYQEDEQDFFFGLEPQLFFRKERPGYQNKKTYFGTEFFGYLKAFAGYDSRDNWKNPKAGVLHQFSFACKAVLDYESAFCRGEGDFRFYIPLFKKPNWHPLFKDSVFALRAFAGYSFFQASPYSLAYSLGGQDSFQNIKALRGFENNRFRGDKMYFFQTEIRFPVLKEYIEAVLFTELGEVAGYKEPFQNFVLDYGGGLRVAFPPNYDMKLRMDYGTGLDLQNQRNYDFTVSFLQAF